MKSLLTIVLSVCGTVLQGYVLTVFWGWFVLTQFPQMPAISLIGALGLCVLLNLFRLPHVNPLTLSWLNESSSEERRNYDLAKVSYHIVAVLLLWGSGFIFHCFM